MQEVWMVYEGCIHEGGGVKVVCATKEAAIRFAKRIVHKEHQHARWGNARERNDNRKWPDAGRHQRFWKRDGNRWRRASDVISVYKTRVY
jgi:hypothetical protein